MLRAVTDAGHPVVWVCDPMHGNTFAARAARRRATSTTSWARSPGSSAPTAPRERGPAASTSS